MSQRAKEICDKFCRSLNARPSMGNYDHQVDTPAGGLHVKFLNGSVYTRFDNPQLAKKRGVSCNSNGGWVFSALTPIDSVLAFQEAALTLFSSKRTA